jgi:hypothetical protein
MTDLEEHASTVVAIDPFRVADALHTDIQEEMP